LHLCKDNHAAGKRPSVTEHCYARSTGKATKGWATINALHFLESEPWINILTIRDNADKHGPVGAANFNSRTIIVMMMAKTPSLNAPSLSVLIFGSQLIERSPSPDS
jgi:hypothetical protein